MSFLQPALLFAIPLIALPIIIHLINQRRFQNVPWAAMSFLLTANRMSRGYARLRQWLILAARTLAILALVFAVSRPLIGGWLGLAGGHQIDTTIILLDRSPSMTQQGAGGLSKLATARQRLIESLGVVPSQRYVLIDSVSSAPLEIESLDALADLPEATATSVTSDLPAMLERAGDYIRENRPSSCEVWICSDVRQSDWQDQSGRWQALRNSWLELPQTVRFHLLAYTDPAPANRSIRVTGVRRSEAATGPLLLLSLRVQQASPVTAPTEVPIQLELDGARSQFNVELTGTAVDVVDHAIPLDAAQTRGGGLVSIPADANPADNEYYFVYDQPVPRKTLIVTTDPESVQPLHFAASIAPDPAIRCSVEVIAPAQWSGIAWEELSLVLWTAAIPGGDVAAELQRFADRGGQIIFFPPPDPDSNSFAGLAWTAWQDVDPQQVSSWVGDRDLLAKANSGDALPVGQLTVARACGLRGDRIALATLADGEPLLARAATNLTGIYFCTTTVSPADSSLADNGVVLYVILQRCLAAGASSLSNARQQVASPPDQSDLAGAGTDPWRLVVGDATALSSRYAAHAGVYRAGEQLIAVNRSVDEDRIETVSADKVDALFAGLPFDRVDDNVGDEFSLVQEVWRLFLALMVAALLIEAALCLPRRPVQKPSPVASARGMAA